jgi:heparan-alpha-glucosaminide N-acetyltransferase
MNSTIELPAANPETLIRVSRVASIDIFRGLTMTLMIFVNELAEVKGLPWWNYHAPAKVNVMTYVDMVFPAFLFILGMMIPIALEHRLRKNSSIPQLWLHIILRTIALLALGFILANAEEGNRSLMGIGTNLWTIVALLGAVLFWNVYPASERYHSLFRVLRFSGLALMIVMFAIFRRTTPQGGIAWINTSYPEILGLLGYTYLAVSFLYLATRRWRSAPFAWFLILTALCIVSTGRWIPFPGRLPLYVWPFGNGAMASIAMAGVATSSIFVQSRGAQPTTLRQKAVSAILFAITAFVFGWLLAPLGISKIRATPTWCLYSIGSSILLFTLLYWVCDVKKSFAWARFSRPAGENTLLTYLLPDFYFFIVSACGFTYFTTHASYGLLGVLRCVVFTALILALSALLTRWKLRLHI